MNPLAQLKKDRAVERIWAADAALWKSEAAHKKIISNSLGWLRMPAQMPERLQELTAFSQEIRAAGFKKVLLLGMGGSSLAPEVMRRVLPAKAGFPMLSVLDSTDPEAVLAMDHACDPKTTLYVVASKSGTTTEPLRLFDYFWGRAQSELGQNAGKHFIAITDPGSFLAGQAQERGFRKVFLNFADIGGRFSALSYFGLVPAALMGADTEEFLHRAADMAKACAKPDAPENPGLELGAKLAELSRSGQDKLTLLMSPEIESLGLWLEQLVAESTGKEGLGVTPVAMEPASPTSLYGKDRVFVLITLDGSRDPQPARLAETFEKAGHPVLRLRLHDALDLGAEFFRWEFATAVLGKALGIDPFDQPDVQSAKDKTKTVLDHRVKTGKLPEVASQIQDDGLELCFSRASKEAGNVSGFDASLSSFLNMARPGDYLGLLPFLSPLGEYDALVLSIAKTLRGRSEHALQTGYGPRYLHSTGQLHKGGADKGLFLLIMREGGPEAAIPGQPYGFADLVNAQAIGDFQALDGAGRRAVLIRMTGDARKGLARVARALERSSARA
ncbi:MAG: glucose-6-phosphate isomerase [Elusimicrobiota bacterium]|jgi:glucose-6-phosphate isomerase